MRWFFWALKTTISIRRFFWVPKTNVKIDVEENIHTFKLKGFVYIYQCIPYFWQKKLIGLQIRLHKWILILFFLNQIYDLGTHLKNCRNESTQNTYQIDKHKINNNILPIFLLMWTVWGQ